MSDWGKGAKNNTIGWGSAACTATNNWGKSQKDSSVAQSWSGDTDISGCSGGAGLAQIDNVYSMQFDGINDFISIDNSSEALNVDFISISAWFYPTSFTNNASIISTPNVANGYHSYNIDLKANGTLDVILRTGVIFAGGGLNYEHNFAGAGALNLNQWNFICMTYDGANVKVTVNTASESDPHAPLNGGALDYSVDPKGDINIGKRNGINAEIAGNLDELAVFNYALTGGEITSIYNATTTGKTADLSQLTTPPVAWYRMGD